jgi:hypothetical protein
MSVSPDPSPRYSSTTAYRHFSGPGVLRIANVPRHGDHRVRLLQCHHSKKAQVASDRAQRLPALAFPVTRL